MLIKNLHKTFLNDQEYRATVYKARKDHFNSTLYKNNIKQIELISKHFNDGECDKETCIRLISRLNTEIENNVQDTCAWYCVLSLEMEYL